MNPEPPPEVLDLLAEREAARARKDYAASDVLRDRIRATGWLVNDTPEGSRLEPAPAFDVADPRAIADTLSQPATTAISVHLLYEGFPEDLERALRGWSVGLADQSYELFVVDNASGEASAIEGIIGGHPTARCLHLQPSVGWASAVNAGLKGSRGELIVVADLSLEPFGDLSGLIAAFDDPGVGLAGPYGLITDDMREFRSAPGPEAHAIEGYLLAVRRSYLARGLFHERFQWYRNADIDLSFQVRSEGARAVVVDLPVRKHEHRGWEAVPETERSERSRANHAVFYGRWRDREDLIRSRP